MKKWLLLGIFLFITLLILKQSKFKDFSPTVETNCKTRLEAPGNKTTEQFRGTPKSVDFSDFPEAKTYYTRITEAVKRGVNFSGHHILIPIGCGTDCVLFAIVDVRTGKVIAYNSGKANYHLINKNVYFVLEPVFTGQTREFYKIDENNQLNIACTEPATKDYYLPTE